MLGRTKRPRRACRRPRTTGRWTTTGVSPASTATSTGPPGTAARPASTRPFRCASMSARSSSASGSSSEPARLAQGDCRVRPVRLRAGARSDHESGADEAEKEQSGRGREEDPGDARHRLRVAVQVRPSGRRRWSPFVVPWTRMPARGSCSTTSPFCAGSVTGLSTTRTVNPALRRIAVRSGLRLADDVGHGPQLRAPGHGDPHRRAACPDRPSRRRLRQHRSGRSGGRDRRRIDAKTCGLQA